MPIEIVFSLAKRALRKIYEENSKTPLEHHVARVMSHFSSRDMTKIFKKCGYLPNGTFDPLPIKIRLIIIKTLDLSIENLYFMNKIDVNKIFFLFYSYS